MAWTSELEYKKLKAWEKVLVCERAWSFESAQFRADQKNFAKHSQEIRALKAEYEQLVAALNRRPQESKGKDFSDPGSADAINRFLDKSR